MAKGKNYLAYTAGIIDGEGCIMLSRKNYNPPRIGYYIRLCITVGNTNEWLIHWLKMQFGGIVTVATPALPNSKDAWRWTLTSWQALSFLELILPYLQLKRPQAELGIKFQRERKKFAKRSEKEKALDEADKILMGKYNQRGIGGKNDS